MANATFNAGIDYFGLVAQSSPKLKVKSSAENRSKQTASGQNSYGDVAVVDSYGETAAPSAEYDVIDAMTEATFPALGSVQTVAGIEKPVVFGTVTINTSNGTAPSVSASGQMVQTGASQLRTYTLPFINITARHRAQDFVCTKSGSTYTPIMDIKKGNTTASDSSDYGLESVSATFPVEITLAQPKGEVVNYDLHGGTVTVNYTMNWYAQTTSGSTTVIDPPTIALTSAAIAAGFTISTPVSKAGPEGGYTQYKWSVSLPMVGEEYVPVAG